MSSNQDSREIKNQDIELGENGDIELGENGDIESGENKDKDTEANEDNNNNNNNDKELIDVNRPSKWCPSRPEGKYERLIRKHPWRFLFIFLLYIFIIFGLMILGSHYD